MDRASDGGRSHPDNVHAVFGVFLVFFLDCHFAANGTVASTLLRCVLRMVCGTPLLLPC